MGLTIKPYEKENFKNYDLLALRVYDLVSMRIYILMENFDCSAMYNVYLHDAIKPLDKKKEKRKQIKRGEEG